MGDGQHGRITRITANNIPGIGEFIGEMSEDEARTFSVDHLKEKAQQVMLQAAADLDIPKRDWGSHSAARPIPFNTPLVELRAVDLPLRFCWYEGSESCHRREESTGRELAKPLPRWKKCANSCPWLRFGIKILT